MAVPSVMVLPMLVVVFAGIYYLYNEIIQFMSKSVVHNKVVVITDAVSAMGSECARLLHEGGAQLVLCGPSWDKLESLHDSLCSGSDPSKTFPPKLVLLDFSDMDGMEEVIAEISECYGYVDVLICNGSMKVKAPVQNLSLDMDKTIMDVNYFGPITLAKGILPLMISRRTGHFIIINSIQGKIAVPFRTSCEYRDLVDGFGKWCVRNHLLLNVSKTKEMSVDFRRKRTVSTPVTIMGQHVELVDTYKYLGVWLDNRLDWKANTEAVYRKGMSRLYFLRKLRSFNVCSKMLTIFYQSVVAGAVFFAAVCWGGSIRAGDAKKLNKLIKKAGSVLGCSLDGFELVVERRSVNKLISILDNPSHPLHDLLIRQRSTFSNRLIQLHCKKERYRKSFVPTAISLYNSSSLCRDIITH
ncbi:dehydrogenase/reductase (SDR family) member 7Cb isoform X1 [Trichomycterus rosablanca]|uniref:dehydrogenase/reductase (SDR family) member 7Cb isoform X1 n=1 Tax=Trichomycterus rosablanca TaxID=2290929 RepID=UPI002F35023D